MRRPIKQLALPCARGERFSTARTPGPARQRVQRFSKVALVLSTAAAFLFSYDVRCFGQMVDFERDIGPLLNEHCASCHGGVKKSGGFSVISRDLLLSETESGQPAVVPGSVEQSHLLHRVSSDDPALRMPPEGQDGLSPREVELLTQWIREGARWPSHWAWQPLPELPPASMFEGEHPIDWFVRRRLQSEGLEPSGPAPAAQLLRRLALDLTGLLPDPQAVDALGGSESVFRHDAPELATIVDGFLASPHFGERWARHWLDEARYADSEGYEKDSVKTDAYRFRDWVIAAINNDMPFDQFTRKQLAGDLLPDSTFSDLVATKFHLQTQFNLEGGVDSEEDRTKRVIDRVGTLGSVWMGTSIGCCQCHDHPYDPFRQQDFYQLYAFFNNADMAADFLGEEPNDADKKRNERKKKWDELTELLQKQLVDKNYSDTTQSRLSQLRNYDNSSGFTRYLSERTKHRRRTYVFARGDFQQPMLDSGELLPAGPTAFAPITARGDVPDRLDLANWLVDPSNPLAARVFVNKVWLHLFGNGIADQPQEFGYRGSAPSHPELLDYLTNWFIFEADWSRKKLIGHIVTSKTYQQSSRLRPEVASMDPGNRLLARQSRFRVEAEIVRDISLQASGLLTARVGGPSVFPPLPTIIAQQTYAGSNKYKVSSGEDRYRRGLYTFFRRTAIDPNLSTFDCPDSSLSKAERDRSNNPLQALATLHNEVFHEAAQHFALRLLTASSAEENADASRDDRFRFRMAFLIALGRPIEDSEVRPLSNLLAKARQYYADNQDAAALLVGDHAVPNVSDAENAAWVAVARVILNTDEFLTRS